MYRFAIIIFGFCFYTGANAGVFYYLRDLPISSFTDDDMRLLRDTAYQALEELKDGEKKAWNNEKSGNSGLLNPLKTYQKDGRLCRTLRVINRSQKKIAELKLEVCEIEEDTWKILSKKRLQ
ncbi:MAG: RT0821/Lpp0805 family surface protein [Gammaproteobacteria bacterium]